MKKYNILSKSEYIQMLFIIIIMSISKFKLTYFRHYFLDLKYLKLFQNCFRFSSVLRPLWASESLPCI